MIFQHTPPPNLAHKLPLPGAMSSGLISLPDLWWIKRKTLEVWEQDYIRPLIPKFDEDQLSPDRISACQTVKLTLDFSKESELRYMSIIVLTLLF